MGSICPATLQAVGFVLTVMLALAPPPSTPPVGVWQVVSTRATAERAFWSNAVLRIRKDGTFNLYQCLGKGRVKRVGDRVILHFYSIFNQGSGTLLKEMVKGDVTLRWGTNGPGGGAWAGSTMTVPTHWQKMKAPSARVLIDWINLGENDDQRPKSDYAYDELSENEAAYRDQLIALAQKGDARKYAFWAYSFLARDRSPEAKTELGRGLRGTKRLANTVANSLDHNDDPFYLSPLTEAYQAGKIGEYTYVAAISEIPGKEVIPALNHALGSSKKETVCAALTALGSRRDPAAKEKAVALMDDSNVEVWIAATIALSRIQPSHPRLSAMKEKVLRAAQSESGGFERYSALKALGDLRIREGIPLLLKSLDDPNMISRWPVVQGLVAMHATDRPDVRKCLEKLSTDPDDSIRNAARNALGKSK